MSKLALFELHEAILCKLRESDELKELDYKFFDEPPRLQPSRTAWLYPCISFVASASEDASTKTEVGASHAIQLEVSNAVSSKDVRYAMGLIHDALHDESFTLEGSHLVFCRFQSCEVGECRDSISEGTMLFKCFTLAKEKDDV